VLETGERVGSAVGLTTVATLSDGHELVTPRFFRRAERARAKAQRRRSNEEKGTPARATRRTVVARVVARVPARSAWRRSAVTHQHSRRSVTQFALLALADVSVHRMVHQPCRAKRSHDGAGSQVARLRSSTAAGARQPAPVGDLWR
jgi:putative transposase